MINDILIELNQIVHNYTIQFLFLLIILDLITGIVKSVVQKKTNSKIGIKGLLKHCLVIITVLVLCLYLTLLGYQPIAYTFVVFFIAQYGLSIVENWGCMGLPVPKFIKERLTQLSNETDEGVFKK